MNTKNYKKDSSNNFDDIINNIDIYNTLYNIIYKDNYIFFISNHVKIL